MNKSKIIVIAVLLIIFNISCKNDKKTIETTPKVEQKVIQEDTHNHNHDTIVLNDGKKWKVVNHMMAHIKNMEKDVLNFNGKSLDDYQNLSKKLDKNIELLTSNCTMTGQAHDELHKWLLPYIDLTNQFQDVKNIDDAHKKYLEIKKSFQLLNTFFN